MGGHRSRGRIADLEDSSWRWRRDRLNALSLASEPDQEQEVRDRLYARPPLAERTVEVLGPIRQIAERPAA
jgi:hypothetical protein